MLLWLPGLTRCCPALHSFGEALSAWVGKALLSNAERKKDSLLASDVAEPMGLFPPRGCFLGRKQPRELWLSARRGWTEAQGGTGQTAASVSVSHSCGERPHQPLLLDWDVRRRLQVWDTWAL